MCHIYQIVRCYAVANAGPRMSAEQVYYIKLENSLKYRFVGIAKDTPADGCDPSQSAFGWSSNTVWAAGVAKRGAFAGHVAQPDSSG